MSTVRFAAPEWLLLLLLVPLLVYYQKHRDRRQGAFVRYSDARALQRLPATMAGRLRGLLPVLRAGGLCCLILGLARPQAGREVREHTAEGIDIMLTLDVSSSMELQDLAGGRRTRLEVAKEVLANFVAGRASDRIGMVVFAAESFTQCPLTLDYDMLREILAGVQVADQAWDGTAIGMALINAGNRLREAQGRSKVIILLTDGVNNAGEIEPLTAAEAVAALGIKVYVVGVGSQGTIRAPVRGVFGTRYQTIQVEIDEPMMRELAARAGGRYFRADSEEKLEEIYREIGQMERTEVRSHLHVDYSERCAYALAPALVLLLVELVLSYTRLRRVP